MTSRRSLGRVLVTGSQGFVGRILLREFRAAGLDVVGLGRRPGAELLADLEDAESVAEAVARARPNSIVHLAGRTYLPEVAADPRAAWRVNVGGTARLLEAVAATAASARVLLVSSCTVYGDPDPALLPLDEEAPTRPNHPYGVQKLEAEALAAAFRERGLEILVVRAFNHIGPGQDPRISVQHFARGLARVRLGLAPPILRTGNLEPRRDFLDVRDVVEAYRLLLEAPQPLLLFNVASGTSVAMGEILARLAAILSVEVEVAPDPARIRVDEAPDLRGDASLLREYTGWRPRIPLDRTLADIAQHALGEAARGT
jgi:GDP-4-dehydro-6-deoxy-D-mannose reductase